MKLLQKLCISIPLLCFATGLSAGEPAYFQAGSVKTQVPTNAGTSYIEMDLVDLSKNVELSPSKDKLIIKEKGVYFLVTSGQIGALTRGAAGYMDIWVVKNGKPFPNSTYRVGISPYFAIGLLTNQFVISLEAGDTIATGYSASAPSLGFIYIQPDNEPAIESFTISLFKITD